jgi:hypothetical protein
MQNPSGIRRPFGLRSGILRRAAAASIAICAAASAQNLLINPGFESPADSQPTDHTATGWTFVDPSVLRSNAYNHTPGGTFSVMENVQQSPGSGVYQNVPHINPGDPLTLSAYWYFQPNFALDAGASVDLGLTWLNNSNQIVGSNFSYISSSSAPLSTWTQYSLTAVAPAGTTQVQVSFDYNNPQNSNAGAPQAAFVDDAALIPNEPFEAPTWIYSGSGDWNNPGNWNHGGPPNGNGASAVLPAVNNGPQTIYTNTPITLGYLDFNSPNEYVIAGAGSLTLANTSTAALVEVDQGTHTLALPITIASNTVLDVASGANLVIANPVTINAGVSLVQGGSGTVTYESAIRFASGASLDVQTAAVTFTGASAATVESQLASGFADGTWSGSGIVSSAARQSGGRYALAFADTAAGVNVQYALVGDANLDGIVNGQDLAILAANFGKSSPDWTAGDFNYSGMVGATDFAGLAANFGRESSGQTANLPAGDYAALQAFAAANGLTSDLPEPALGLTALAALSLISASRGAISPSRRNSRRNPRRSLP